MAEQPSREAIVKRALGEYGANVAVLKEYVPAEVSVAPEDYLALVAEKVMGRDKSGKMRPFPDFLMLMQQARRAQLDPLARQIYAVYRWNGGLGREVMTIQISIDGARLIAQRTGTYAGSDDAIFDSEEEPNPKKATITVYKLNSVTGERMPITASARWSEYAQTTSPMWKKMPYLMLSKVAESLALRKAFPQELSGLYTTDEMAQATIVTRPPAALEEGKESILEKAVGKHININEPFDVGTEPTPTPEQPAAGKEA